MNITPASFMFTNNFPTIDQPTVENAIVAVEAEWSGCFSLWGVLDAATANAKRILLENYLVGWWLADFFPEQASGVVVNGGMSLLSKSVGGVSVTFLPVETQDGLSALRSNSFGEKALNMILSAPERMGVYG